MKKYLFFLLTLVVASLAFISCRSDDDDNGDYDKSMILGTWDMTAVMTSESGTYVDWPFRKTYATFNADGSYFGSGFFGTGRGTWSLKGNTLNTYVEGELFASYTIISATSTVSEMKMSSGDESLWVKCKKQCCYLRHIQC